MDNLIPELKKLFEQNSITLTEGSNYSNLDEEEQHNILNLILSGQDEARKEIKNLVHQKIELMKKIEVTEKDMRVLREEKNLLIQKEKENPIDNALNIEKITRKDKEIKALQEELLALKKKPEARPKEDKPFISKIDEEMLKCNLEVKLAFDQCKNVINALHNSTKKYLQKLDSSTNLENILKEEDIIEKYNLLNQLLLKKEI